MFLYYLTSFVNGFMNSVNKMTNVKAGQCFGAAKGSLINYLEATFLSLALVFMTSDPSELAPSHVFSVPAWAYPVSYTHLDVYKRQRLITAALMLAGGLSIWLYIIAAIIFPETNAF